MNTQPETPPVPKPPSASPRLDEARELRNAFGSFATGVAVVTTTAIGGERVGTTINSFGSVSIDPPLVLFSIARSARAFAVWSQCEQFAINILREEQSELCARFALSLSDKWQGIESISGPLTRSPLLPGTLAYFECGTDRRYDGGDHLIILGRVLSFGREHEGRSEPLVFFGGKLRSLSSPAEA